VTPVTAFATRLRARPWYFLSDDVTVVDVAGAKAIKSIPVGRVPYGLVVVE